MTDTVRAQILQARLKLKRLESVGPSAAMLAAATAVRIRTLEASLRDDPEPVVSGSHDTLQSHAGGNNHNDVP